MGHRPDQPGMNSAEGADRPAAVPAGTGGDTAVLRLLRPIAGGRMLALQALIVVVLLASAQAYDGSIHSLSHWFVLSAYAACSIGLGLAEWRGRRQVDAGTGRPEGRWAEALTWAATILNAAVAVYVEIEHMTAGAADGFDEAAGAVSRLPAFLLLLQTGLTMRVGHTIVFAASVTLAWGAAILFAAFGPSGAILGPHVTIGGEAPALLTFVAASLVVIERIRRLRAALSAALRLEHERSLLARFVPGSVSVRLAQEGGFDAVRERHACLFVLDIRGFSALTRERDREEVVRALLDMRALVHACVGENGGIVDKYVGDGVIAHFLVGTPAVQAEGALGASFAILQRLEVMNGERRRLGLPALRVSIALHAGIVLAGVFDDGLRAEFTALGSAMNMLSRLEARAKALDLPLALSEDVVRLLPPDRPALTRVTAPDSATGREPALYAPAPIAEAA